ncbi:MAG: taurine dioxygenase [Gammaproteobacteria bacterium]|jgi:taurine dioxygenase
MAMKSIEGPLLSDSLGREILGVDLAEPLTDDAFSAIESAFQDNPVLVFRKQSLGAPEYARFANRFGDIRPGVIAKYRHPQAAEISYLSNVNEDGTIDDFGVKRASAWHYDGSFAARPPILAMLYALEIPQIGGGTLFADMYRAYETLPSKLKQQVDTLITVNHFGLGPSGAEYFAATTPEHWAGYAPIKRPLVMRHRLSGRPYLEFCLIHTAGFVGMTHGESWDLLHELAAHSTRDELVYYHQWRAGDVVLWDEHATLHRNAGDFPPEQRRIMLRAMVNEN